MQAQKEVPLKILSISCVYPNPAEPTLGLFVKRRLQHLAAFAEVKAIAPIPVFDYSNPAGKYFRRGDRAGPVAGTEGDVPVLHPRWFYPPFGGAINAFLLFLRLLWPVVRLRKEFPFQLIDTHFAHPEGIAGALLSVLLRSPLTITLRGSETAHARYRFRRYGMKWALQRANRVFTVSERLRQFAIALGVAPAKVKTIPNGIDGSIFFPRDRSECRRKHGIPFDGPVLLSAGYLVEGKGHHRVIMALKALGGEGLVAYLVIAGGPGRQGQYEGRIRKLVADLGLEAAVRIRGEVTPGAMAELMSAADVLCLASSREGWPNVVHEALGCGTPVVATNVGAVPELIPSDRYGIVVPPHDQASLEEALRKALQKKWDRPAICAWGQARSWEQVAQEVLQEVRQIILEETEQPGPAVRACG